MIKNILIVVLICFSQVSLAEVVKVLALGDAGEGNIDQYKVAMKMASHCQATPGQGSSDCSFVAYLGDNFYNGGVSSPSDSQFITKFEQPYLMLNIPFYIALGNHDYGETGLEFWKPYYQLLYARANPLSKWKMPAYYYRIKKGDVELFVIDTQGIYLNWNYEEQLAWLTNALNNSSATWKIVAGHHPYISNGEHGNAGNYEGCYFCGIVRGKFVKKFIEQAVCGKADFYLSGHDHNLQWLDKTCGTEFIVSGAGSKLTNLVYRDNNAKVYDNDTETGFVSLSFEKNSALIEFYSQENLLYSKKLIK